MNTRLYSVVLGAFAALGLALGACSSGGDESTGGAGGGGGNPTTTTTTGGSGTGGGTGTGGGGVCRGCAAYLTECVVADPPAEDCGGGACEGESSDLFDALSGCVCTECATECAHTCAQDGGEDTECTTCFNTVSSGTGACTTQMDACAGDV